MLKSQMKSFFAALVLVLVLGAEGLSEGRPDAYSTDSDRIARAEQRVDQLRAKLFELETREMDLLARIDDLDYRLTPEAIQRALAFVGSPRPLDEFREALRIRLEAQRVRINRQLELVTANREQVMWAIREAEAEIERPT
jgi:cell division protein FtsB